MIITIWATVSNTESTNTESTNPARPMLQIRQEHKFYFFVNIAKSITNNNKISLLLQQKDKANQ